MNRKGNDQLAKMPTKVSMTLLHWGKAGFVMID